MYAELKEPQYKKVRKTIMKTPEIRAKLLLDSVMSERAVMDSALNPTSACLNRTVSLVNSYYPRKKISTFEYIQEQKTSSQSQRKIIPDYVEQLDYSEITTLSRFQTFRRQKIVIENQIESKKKIVKTHSEVKDKQYNLLLVQPKLTPKQNIQINISFKNESYSQDFVEDGQHITLNFTEGKIDFGNRIQIERRTIQPCIQEQSAYKSRPVTKKAQQFQIIKENLRSYTVQLRNEFSENEITVVFNQTVDQQQINISKSSFLQFQEYFESQVPCNNVITYRKQQSGLQRKLKIEKVEEQIKSKAYTSKEVEENEIYVQFIKIKKTRQRESKFVQSTFLKLIKLQSSVCQVQKYLHQTISVKEKMIFKSFGHGVKSFADYEIDEVSSSRILVLFQQTASADQPNNTFGQKILPQIRKTNRAFPNHQSTKYFVSKPIKLDQMIISLEEPKAVIISQITNGCYFDSDGNYHSENDVIFDIDQNPFIIKDSSNNATNNEPNNQSTNQITLFDRFGFEQQYLTSQTYQLLKQKPQKQFDIFIQSFEQKQLRFDQEIKIKELKETDFEKRSGTVRQQEIKNFKTVPEME
ncbi:Hypothetical_protein [Hexamita inflata]|uniref:Hypothetical_protein n=1 Tax=Hexamita inflata TaxID=28002 RepID=A0AA86NAY6_9EUKA|nr:Hypothetical protein HINF_LOCUS3984 [Hexamita inflata]